MAAKHDAKKARANHWVMQQNLAKQKGGRPGYQFTEKRPVKPAKKPPSPNGEAKTPADPASATTDATARADTPPARDPSND